MIKIESRMKPILKIQLKRKLTRSSTRHLSLAHDRIAASHTDAKTEQLKAAVNYCKENNCKGYAALSTGMFPLIIDPRTINTRLDNTSDSEIIIENGKTHQRVLTFQEENNLALYLKNKNR